MTLQPFVGRPDLRDEFNRLVSDAQVFTPLLTSYRIVPADNGKFFRVDVPGPVTVTACRDAPEGMSVAVVFSVPANTAPVVADATSTILPEVGASASCGVLEKQFFTGKVYRLTCIRNRDGLSAEWAIG